jgi:hypothetical protein
VPFDGSVRGGCDYAEDLAPAALMKVMALERGSGFA